jgi:hypothetical protein
MIRTLALAVAALLLTTAAVSADGLPPMPRGMKYVRDPQVRFAGFDQHPDYVFFLWYRFSRHPDSKDKDGPPSQIKDVTVPRRLSWGNRSSWTLLAMKRLDFERRAKDASKLDWLTDKTEGVLSAGLPRPSNMAPETMEEVPVATYHVTIQDGKLSVELENDPRAAPPLGGLVPLWAFGLVGSVAIAWLGLWYVRRRPATPPPGEPT